MSGDFLLVITASDSFADFWPLLGGEYDVAVQAWSPTGAEPPPTGAFLAVLAAGGREADLAALLPGLATRVGAPLIAVGALASHRVAARAVAAGATDYLALPEDRDALRQSVAVALERRRTAEQRERFLQLEAQAHAFQAIVGESPILRAALERAARILPHGDTTVLVSGETGTGKELVARALHYGGPRAAAPFVELNCAALPVQLLESELFGHERGAFTDARTAKPGLFEVAQGGTLFLDEVHQLALDLQSKLLRALEHKTIRRLGATAGRSVNVRIIAATNTELAESVRAGQFREDLFYRLNVFTVTLPPLRERGDDVIRLATTFLRRFAAQYGVAEPPLGPEDRQRLLNYPWPGNVRELRNQMERALLLSPPGTLVLDGLTPAAVAREGALPFPADLQTIQRAAATRMVEATGGNRSEAARRLGISRARLLRLLTGQADTD